MKDKIPRSQKEQLEEKRRSQSAFVACGKIINGGAFYENGSECRDGYWIYWATAYDDNGNDMYGKPVRWVKPCSCRIAWREGYELSAAKGPQAALAGDSKAKAAGE